MPKELTITAKVPANKGKGTPELGPCTVIVDTGEDVEEMKGMFGAEAIKTNAEANWIVTIQNNIRSGLRKGEAADHIATRLRSAKMGVAQKGAQVDPVQAYLARFQGATPEEQAKMIAELKARAVKKG